MHAHRNMPAFVRGKGSWGRGRMNYQPFPLVNVQETDQHIVLEVMAPGRKKENFQVTVKGNILTIASNLETQWSEHYRTAEFKLIPFRRSFRLISPVQREAIEARYADGVLYVTLPKQGSDTEPAQQIDIQ